MSVGGATTRIHSDGDLNGQGQHLKVIMTQAFPPYSHRFLTELHRLYMTTPQMQAPHLVDDEVAKGRVSRMQKPLIGLEVLQRKIIGLVAAAVIWITGV